MSDYSDPLGRHITIKELLEMGVVKKNQSPALEKEISKPFFKIIEPGGHEYQIFGNGTATGFAEGAIMCNYIAAKLDGIQGQLIQAINNGELTRQKLAEIFS